MKLFKRTRAIARNGCLVLLATTACALAGTAGHDPHVWRERSWQDIESRIQYGYFTEDSRALRNLSQQLSGERSEDTLRSYYNALLAYRLTQLAVQERGAAKGTHEPDKARARELLGRCVESLDQVLAVNKDFVEGIALQAACLGMAGDIDFWRGPINGVRSSAQLKRALQLAPGNPRVLLLQALVDASRSEDKAISELKKALTAFEAERRESSHVPSWGAPEAYVLMARLYLRRGDAVSARDALERSLLLAPDFAQARRLLLHITS